ncbi:MAG: hypothetical protein PHW93_01980 [Candidatus Methanomethylophilaceae archaeon]|nr:hypothetical protein [Candidatus Methanomethylophilaceae archaeon]
MLSTMSDRIYRDRYFSMILIVGLLFVGLMSMVIGLYYLNNVSRFMDIDADAYNMAKLLMMGFVILIGVYALLKSCVLEGLFILFIGMSTFIFAATHVLQEADGLLLGDIIIGIFLLIFSFLFYRKGDYLLGMASFLMGFAGAFYSLFSGDALFLLIGLGCFLSGLLEFLYSLQVWNEVVSKPSAFPWLEDENGFPFRAAGYPLMAALLLLVGAYYLNVVLGFTAMDVAPYNIAKGAISLIVIYIGVMAIHGRAFTAGMVFLLLGLSTFTFAASMVTGNGSGLEIMDLFLGLSLLFAAVMAYKSGENDLAMASFLISLGLTVYILLTGDLVFYAVGIPIFLAGLVFLACGIRAIWEHEVEQEAGA